MRVIAIGGKVLGVIRYGAVSKDVNKQSIIQLFIKEKNGVCKDHPCINTNPDRDTIHLTIIILYELTDGEAY